MRILLLDQFAEMGGAQRCLVDISAGFADRGWDVHAAVPHGELFERLRRFCGHVDALACGPFHSTRKTAADAALMFRQIGEQRRAIAKFAAGGDPGVVYVNGPRLMPAAALGRGSAAVVFHAHSIVEQRAAAMLLRLSIRAARATVIANSKFVAAPLAHAANGRLRVVLNGVSNHAGPRRRDGGRFTIALLGRIAREKGQLEFVRAARLVRSTADCRFVIAGAPMFSTNGYFDRVREEAAGLDIEFTDWIEDVPAFLAGVDLLAVPSSACDATPRVIPEAFSAGTPVLASAAGGIAELIREGHDALLVHGRSPQALADGMIEAIRNPGRLQAMAERARLRWREAFTVERFRTDVAETVQEVALRSHQRSPLARAGATVEA